MLNVDARGAFGSAVEPRHDAAPSPSVKAKPLGSERPAMQAPPATPGFAVPLRFLVGIAAAVAATLAMDAVMNRRPEGATPPTVAAGVLTDRHPDLAPERLATVVHYLAGGLSGGLYVWLLYATEATLDTTGGLATVVAAVVMLALMIGFFAVVVLPRSRIQRGRRSAVRRDWTAAAATYVVVLAPLVALGTEIV